MQNFTIVFETVTTGAMAGINSVIAGMESVNSTINTTHPALARMSDQFHGLGDAATQAGNAHQKAAGQMRGFAAGLGEIAAGLVVTQGIQAAIGFIGQLGEAAEKTRERLKEMTDEAMKTREAMREVANLKKHDGPDNEVAADVLKLGVASGMMPAEAIKFAEQFEGSIPMGEQLGHIDEKTKREFAVEGARFAVRIGMDPKTGGDLAGVIPQFKDLTHDDAGREIPQEKRLEVAMGELGRFVYGLNEGRGNVSPLTRSVLSVAGELVGEGMPMKEIGDFGTIAGVTSTHSNVSAAGNRTARGFRALRLKPDAAGDYLRRIGVVDGDKHMDRLEKLAPKVAEAMARGQGAGEFLMQQGWNSEETQALTEQIRDLPTIKKRIANSHGVTGASVIAANNRFFEQDRVGVRRKQMATKTGTEFLIGQASERFAIAKENAEQEMRASGEIRPNDTWGGTWDAAMETIHGGGNRERARDHRLAVRATQDLVKEARRVGLSFEDVDKALGGDGKIRSRGPGGEAGEGDWQSAPGRIAARTASEQSKRYEALATLVQDKGGSPFGPGVDIAPKLDEMARQHREGNRLLQQIANQGGPGGRPQPNPPPLGPMGGAAVPRRP